MKQVISLLTAISLFFSPLLRADSSEDTPSCIEEEAACIEPSPCMEEPSCIQPLCIEEPLCCEEDERVCTHKMVGKAPDDRLSAYKRKRFLNWVLAIGVVVIGITTLILVGRHHKK